MDSIKRNKRLGWAVLLLIVMNIVSLSALWIGYSKRPGERGKGEAGGVFLENRLELTTAQNAQLKDLRDDHFRKMDDLRRSFHEARKALHDLWKSENGAALVDDQAEKVGQLQAEMEKEIFNHFAAIRDLCTDKQKAIFDDLIEDVLRRGERRGGPPGEGAPPRRHRPGPGGNLPPAEGH